MGFMMVPNDVVGFSANIRSAVEPGVEHEQDAMATFQTLLGYQEAIEQGDPAA